MKTGISFLCFLLLFSCQKPAERACWKGAGNVIKQQVPFESFAFLHIYPHMKVVLIQDSLNYIEWEANENLMNFLEAEKALDTLILRNRNRCHFLRYQKEQVNVKVHFSALQQILFENSDTVRTQGIWEQNDVTFILKEGAGLIQLELAGHHAFIRNLYGWQDLQLKGQLNWLYVDLDGSASLEAQELNLMDSLLFSSASPKSSRLSSEGIKVKAQLHSIGDLYLKGTPSTLLQTTYSSGKIIVE